MMIGSRPFNPHPLRRADATNITHPHNAALFGFQSSSAPKSGCYVVGEVVCVSAGDLSILIRSEERMLRARKERAPDRRMLSILIRSEERMLRPLTRNLGVNDHLSILIRSEERMLRQPEGKVRLFSCLSILIRSEERMLHIKLRRSFADGGSFNPHPLRRADATTARGHL